MPRANRQFFPGHVWHFTRRYHQKSILLKFARTRSVKTSMPQTDRAEEHTRRVQDICCIRPHSVLIG
jgi:hypothetical protein